MVYNINDFYIKVSKSYFKFHGNLLEKNFIRPRFEHIVNNNSPESESDEDMLKHHIHMIQLIRADLQGAIDHYDKLFIK